MYRDRVLAAARGSWQAAFVTLLALSYARIWRAQISYDEEFGLFVCSGMKGGFARGGTTLGGVYLTRKNVSRPMRRHEAVHSDQWARFGLSFAIRYLWEERKRPGSSNRFEVEAGLEDGGYLRGPSPGPDV